MKQAKYMSLSFFYYFLGYSQFYCLSILGELRSNSMALQMESGLKVLQNCLYRPCNKIISRMPGFKKESVLEHLFAGKIASVAGESIVEFAFTSNASTGRHQVIFDTLLAQTAPKCIGGLESECILLDTESSFSVLDFAVFIENYLTANTSQASQTDTIDQVR